MIEALRDGWRHERADMIKLLLMLSALVSILVGVVVALWASDHDLLAAAAAAYFIGDFRGYFRGRDHERKAYS